jgi:hypothetical protein
MNFQVPQFIEVEDKIFGPLTFKQFVYLAGAGGLAFMEWVYIPIKFIAVIFVAPTVAFGLLLAFYKINNRPFINVVESAFYFFIKRKLYIWKRVPTSQATKDRTLPSQSAGALKIPKLSGSKLKDLSWSLDVREKIK